MAYNEAVEGFRDTEYPMLKGKVYLDHGGTTIYARSLIEEFSQKMLTNLYGNPHSKSDPAMLSGTLVDSIRLRALAFFNADPEHFDLVFTANTTAALKLVADSFQDLAASNPRAPSFWYGYHRDAHTSVVGIREMTNGNHYCFTDDEEVEDFLHGQIGVTGKLHNKEGLPGLFAYPAQSNMTGRRLPLGWAKRLRRSIFPTHQNTYSLLDAAAFATTSQIDLSDPESAPDFVTVSFYKIFGFPDLGALIIRKASGHIMSWRKYFGGGTVNALTVLHTASVIRRADHLHDGLEDGTLPFHSIIALGCAIDVHRKLYGSMETISQHTSFLGYRLLHAMENLTHYNGAPLCLIYNDPGRSTHGDPITQGSTIAFSLLHADGTYIGHAEVEEKANRRNIYLRSGGLCNSGGISTYLEMEPWQFKRAWSAGHRCGDHHVEVVNGKPTGVVRASLGAMTVIADVDALILCLEEEFLEGMCLISEAEKLELLDNNSCGVDFAGDSGFISGTEAMPHVFSLGQINARRMISTPNLRSRMVARDPRVNPQRSFYDHRPTTATSIASQASQASPASRPPLPYYQELRPGILYNQIRLDSFGTPTPADRSQSSSTLDRDFQPLMPGLGQNQNEAMKKESKLKFWRQRKALSPAINQ
ncbi:hypothetical protein PZA11_001557 [Diplocarpon coronariae]|uniref:Aminotransferase class V domain-containing protein n=1 Tax=Diplocarpon coronariae TaxID=2795749 RepID=A0A218ZCQ3_9HELO|nr:hypothetical protein JHW43_008794 [Diplocarpon mali]OWP05807.1 hypothetical protein B2J93_925 [Marssonina coronariae]